MQVIRKEKIKYGYRVRGQALLYFDHLVGKEYVQRPGKRGVTVWMVQCSMPRCNQKFPLHAAILSKKVLCILHRHDALTALMIKQKGNRELAKKIYRTEQKVGTDGRLRRIAYIKCETKTCRNEYTAASVIRHGHTKCLQCREGAKYILGHYCRNPFFLMHAEQIIATTASGHSRRWFVKCRGSVSRRNSCHTKVRLTSNKSLADHKCSKCVGRKTRNAPLTSHYKAMIRSAMTRGLEMTVSFQDFVAFCACKTCFYCGSQSLSIGRDNKSTAYALDRADNSKGYTKGNIVPCCKFCNRVKWHTLTAQQMVIWASLNGGNFARAKKASLMTHAQIMQCVQNFVNKHSALGAS